MSGWVWVSQAEDEGGQAKTEQNGHRDHGDNEHAEEVWVVVGFAQGLRTLPHNT